MMILFLLVFLSTAGADSTAQQQCKIPKSENDAPTGQHAQIATPFTSFLQTQWSGKRNHHVIDQKKPVGLLKILAKITSEKEGERKRKRKKRRKRKDKRKAAHKVHRQAHMHCSKNYWTTLKTCVKMYDDGTAFVRTGDIEDMWIRDSSAQLHPYIPLASNSSEFQTLLEGALRSQAKYIAIDPYANSYGEDYRHQHHHHHHHHHHHYREWNDDRLLRGGYVRTANYEMDSGPYFIRFLKTYMAAVPGSTLLKEPQIHEAVKILLELYKLEQHHNRSKYNYPTSPPWELPDGPQGSPVGYTGMVWNAFRPSDDAHMYGYHIPGNLFLATCLSFVTKTAREVWRDDQLAADADRLQNDILKGIEKFGVTEVEGRKIYCYEVDGFGNCNLMDDANVPSLLSIPYLDPTGDHYDPKIYKHTRQFILSKRNPWFFKGTEARGIGSSHTGEDRIWPMSLIMEAFTTESTRHRTTLIDNLVRTAKHGLLHESFHKDDHSDITRTRFAWPNALFAELVGSIGYPCGTPQNSPRMPKSVSRSRAGPLSDLPGLQSFYTADVQALRYRAIPGLNLMATSAAKSSDSEPWI